MIIFIYPFQSPQLVLAVSAPKCMKLRLAVWNKGTKVMTKASCGQGESFPCHFIWLDMKKELLISGFSNPNEREPLTESSSAWLRNDRTLYKIHLDFFPKGGIYLKEITFLLLHHLVSLFSSRREICTFICSYQNPGNYLGMHGGGLPLPIPLAFHRCKANSSPHVLCQGALKLGSHTQLLSWNTSSVRLLANWEDSGVGSL